MRKGFLVAVLIINAFALAALYSANLEQAKRSGKTVLPVYGQVGDFALLDQNQSEVTRQTLSGKPWIANFMFSRCAGACPVMSVKMGGFQKSLGHIRLVSFSVDPERDSPAALAEYAKKYAAESGRWFFLTGSKETLNNVSNSVHLGSLGDLGMHSLRFVLVDADSNIRGYYDSTDAKAIQKLLHDAKRLDVRSSRSAI